MNRSGVRNVARPIAIFLLGCWATVGQPLFAQVVPASVQPTTAIRVRVLGPTGLPLSGAVVAAVPQGADASRVVKSTTAVNGEVALSLPAGTYGVTATHPDYAEAYLPELGSLEVAAASTVVVSLRDGGHRITGRLVDSSGEVVRDSQVTFGRISDQQSDLFVAPMENNRFALRLTDGSYNLFARGANDQIFQERIEVHGELLDKIVVLERGPTAAPAAARAWIKNNMIALDTVVAGDTLADLAPFKRIVGEARVVALGEATHGTREFFQAKHRLLQYTVEELGFTLFGIEANLPEARVVNDYVLNGVGDPAKALKGLYFWTWDTEEVLEMLRWMRRYNEDSNHQRKIQFFGFDMQEPKIAASGLHRYLQRVESDVADSAQVIVSHVANHRGVVSAAPEIKLDIERRIDEVDHDLRVREQAYIARAGRSDYADAREDLTVVRQYLAYAVKDWRDRQRVRDQAMAHNVLATLRRHPDAKAVLWAHNLHVSSAPDGAIGGIASMGLHLRNALGAKFLNVGFVFGRGGFQAIDDSPAKRGRTTFTVAADPSATLAEALASAMVPIGLLDLRKLPPSGPAFTWFHEKQGSFQVGANFADTYSSVVPQRITQHYDVLLFIEETSAARANK